MNEFAETVMLQKYSTAMKHVGDVFVEQADVCEISGKSTCG